MSLTTEMRHDAQRIIAAYADYDFMAPPVFARVWPEWPTWIEAFRTELGFNPDVPDPILAAGLARTANIVASAVGK